MKKCIKIATILCLAALILVAFASCDKGTDALSAYEIAVKNGFEGTEKEWLESLVGQTTVNQTTNNFTVEGKTQDISVASNVGLKSVVSVFSEFTVLPAAVCLIPHRNNLRQLRQAPAWFIKLSITARHI